MARYRTLLLSLLAVSCISNTYGDEPETLSEWFMSTDRYRGVAPVSNESYQEECGSCHFAYPPGLLPEASWKKLLDANALADHFGENAELDAAVLNEITAYALKHSADKSYYKRSRKIDYATTENNTAPLRITEVSYIKRKHHEIPERLIKGNPEVNSLSNCNACHTKASDGVFDDDAVRIPGYGAWDD